jgi:hypothetical protein
VVLVAERVDALFGARLFFVAAGAAERGVELILVQRLLQRLRLHNIRMDLLPCVNGPTP